MSRRFRFTGAVLAVILLGLYFRTLRAPTPTAAGILTQIPTHATEPNSPHAPAGLRRVSLDAAEAASLHPADIERANLEYEQMTEDISESD